MLIQFRKHRHGFFFLIKIIPGEKERKEKKIFRRSFQSTE